MNIENSMGLLVTAINNCANEGIWGGYKKPFMTACLQFAFSSTAEQRADFILGKIIHGFIQHNQLLQHQIEYVRGSFVFT